MEFSAWLGHSSSLVEGYYGNWPASGEIDIMEARGNPPSYAPGGYNSFGSTLQTILDPAFLI